MVKIEEISIDNFICLPTYFFHVVTFKIVKCINPWDWVKVIDTLVKSKEFCCNKIIDEAI